MPAHQLQGELAISVPRHRHREIITAGKGCGICPVYTVVSNDLFCTFKYFVLLKACKSAEVAGHGNVY